MFGHNAGLWEVATQDVGVAILLIVGSLMILVAVGLVIAGIRSNLHIYSVVFYVLAIMSLALISLPSFIFGATFADTWNQKEAKKNAYAQIEQKYDIDVQGFNTIRMDGGNTLRSEGVTKVYGVLSTTIDAEDGSWSDIEFKYDFTKDEDVVLYPVDATTENKEPVDPKQFLK